MDRQPLPTANPIWAGGGRRIPAAKSDVHAAICEKGVLPYRVGKRELAHQSLDRNGGEDCYVQAASLVAVMRHHRRQNTRMSMASR
jgi:hypothetical protein